MDEPPLTSPFDFLGEDSIHKKVIQALNETNRNMTSSWTFDKDLSSLHSDPIFMPKEFLQQRGFEIIMVFLAVSLLHTIILSLFKKYNPAAKNLEHWRESCQVLNMIVNIFFGILGIHYHYFLRFPAVSLEYTINQWDHFAIFGVVQAGYQIWSIIIGIFIINEPLTMLMHHMSFVCAAFISISFSNGLRYYTAFFCGVVEISSVPLAAMNIFKNNPSLVQKYPTTNLIVKISFAILFILLRVVFWAPIMCTFLRLTYILSSTCPTMLCFVYLRTYMACATFLTFLQMYWAWKIIKGMLKMAGLMKKKSKLVKEISSSKEE